MIFSHTHARSRLRSSSKSRASVRHKKPSRTDTVSTLPPSALPSPSPSPETVTLKSFKPKSRKVESLIQFASEHKVALTYACITVYIFLGPLFVLLVETYMEPHMEYARPKEIKQCLSYHGYWSALQFMVSASSTIGFGNVYACTSLGRAMSTCIGLVGVPMVVYILSNLGKQLCTLVCRGYPYVQRQAWIGLAKVKVAAKSVVSFSKRSRCRRPGRRSGEGRRRKMGEVAAPRILDEAETLIRSGNNNHHDVESTAVENEAEIVDRPLNVPTSIGIGLTLSCVGIVALFYRFNENYAGADAIYYGLMTFLGGDFVMDDYKWVVPMYATIFLGFSMLSLTISLFQRNMEKFMVSVQARLMENVQRMIAEAREASEDPSSIDASGAVDEALSKTKAPWWLKSLIPKQEIEMLKDTVAQAVNKKDLGVSASLSYTRRIYQTSDVGAQCAKPTKTFGASQTEQPTHRGNQTSNDGAADAIIQSDAICLQTTASDAKPSTKTAFTQENVILASHKIQATVNKSNAFVSTHQASRESTCQTAFGFENPCAEVQVTSQVPVRPTQWHVPTSPAHVTPWGHLTSWGGYVPASPTPSAKPSPASPASSRSTVDSGTGLSVSRSNHSLSAKGRKSKK